MIKKKKVFDPVPEGLLADYSKLENILQEMVQERSRFYRVKEWRPWFYCVDAGSSLAECVKRYTFVGYLIEYGFLFPKKILSASFDTPETHDLEKPLPAEDQFRILAVSYNPQYFQVSHFQEKLKKAFPLRYLHIEEIISPKT